MDPTLRIDAGLSHPYARPTLLFGWTMLVVSAIIGGAIPPVRQWELVHWSVVITVGTAFLIVSLRERGPLRAPWPVLVVGLSLLCAVLVLFAGEHSFSRTIHEGLGALNMGVCLLILRGHVLIGALSSAALIVSGVGVGIVAGSEPIAHFQELSSLLLTLFAACALSYISLSIARDRSRMLDLQLRTATATDAVRSLNVGTDRALSEIPPIIDPLLQRISAGESLTAEFHAQLLAADEAVRGHLRRDLPYHAGFLRAVSEARSRGAAVRMLGGEAPSPLMSESLAEKLIILLSGEGLRSATVRFAPDSRGGGASILVEGSGGTQRHDLDAAGRLRRAPS